MVRQISPAQPGSMNRLMHTREAGGFVESTTDGVPLSQPMSFNGSTDVVSYDPATFTISTPAPTGAFVQTSVFAGW